MSKLGLSDKTAILIIVNLFKYSISFLIPIALVRVLTKHDYGTYQQVLLAGRILLSVFVIGIPFSMYYFLGVLDEDKRGRFISQTKALLFIFGCLAAAFTLIFSGYIGEHMSNEGLKYLLLIYAGYILFYISGEYLEHTLIMLDRVRLLIWISPVENIIRVVFLFVPILLGAGVPGIVAGLSVYAVLRFAAYWLIDARVRPGRRFSFDPALLKDQFVYTLPIALQSFVAIGNQLLDKIFVAVAFTPAHFAIYSVGSFEVPLDVIVQASVANILRARLPYLIKTNDYPEIIRLWKESVRKQALIVLPVFAFFAVNAGIIIPLVFTEAYMESISIFRIYLLSMPLQIVCLSLFPQSFGKTKINFYISVASLAFNFAAVPALLYAVGFWGPAIAAVLSMYFASACYLFVAVKLLKTGLKDFIPLATVIKTALCAMLASLSGLLPFFISWHPALVLALSAAAFAAIYIAGVSALNILTGTDRKLIMRWITLKPVIGRS